MDSHHFDRLAFIANKTASVAARLEELEHLREQVRRAEHIAAGMPAIDANRFNRVRLAAEKPRKFTD
jgi:hypothetical protein